MSLPLPWVDRIFEKLVLVYGQPFLARWRDIKLDAVKVELAAKESSLAELAAKLEEANAKVAALEQSKTTASAEAANILAASGVEPVAAPVAQSVEGSVAEQYAAMPAGAERRAFFKKHKAVLFSAK